MKKALSKEMLPPRPDPMGQLSVYPAEATSYDTCQECGAEIFTQCLDQGRVIELDIEQLAIVDIFGDTHFGHRTHAGTCKARKAKNG